MRGFSMPGYRRAMYLAAAALTALTCCLAPATAGAAARADRAGAAGSTFTGFLNDVYCVTSSDCWAFGQDSAQHAVAEHWTGSAWAMVPVAGPPGSRSTYLPAVSCAGAADCWAVGQYQQHTGGMVAFAEHWNGTAWSPVSVPVPSGSIFSLLIAVSCAGPASCWAVGAGAPATFMERWNGRAWRAVRTPGLGSEANPERVSCPTATDCWVSGMHGNGSTGGTLIGHWTGGAWAAVPTPTAHIPADSLLGISCQATACMTVGSRGNTRTLAQRWNGSAWAVTPTGTAAAVLYAVSCVNPGGVSPAPALRARPRSVSPAPALRARPRSVSPAPALRARPRSCMAVGGSNGGNGRVFTERWSRSQWHVVPAPSPRGGNSSLVGVSCAGATDCWGAGSYFNGTADRSLIEHWNGTAWSIVS